MTIEQNIAEMLQVKLTDGTIEKVIEDKLTKCIDECMRVLEPEGVLIFKWNEEQIKLKQILEVIGQEPLFGDKRSKTHWLVFMKLGGMKEC